MVDKELVVPVLRLLGLPRRSLMAEGLLPRPSVRGLLGLVLEQLLEVVVQLPGWGGAAISIIPRE